MEDGIEIHLTPELLYLHQQPYMGELLNVNWLNEKVILNKSEDAKRFILESHN